jgi:uncharacterized membrane protein
MKRFLPTALIGLCMFIPQISHAQEVIRAKVTKIISEEKTEVELGIGSGFVQLLEAATVFTKERGEEKILVTNDYVPLRVGNRIFIQGNSEAGYVVSEIDRTRALGVLAVAFLAVLVLFGGIQGIRGLASLIGSLLLIVFVLVPNLLTGASPVLVSLSVAALITALPSGLWPVALSRSRSSEGSAMVAAIIAATKADFPTLACAVMAQRLPGVAITIPPSE